MFRTCLPWERSGFWTLYFSLPECPPHPQPDSGFCDPVLCREQPIPARPSRTLAADPCAPVTDSSSCRGSAAASCAVLPKRTAPGTGLPYSWAVTRQQQLSFVDRKVPMLPRRPAAWPQQQSSCGGPIRVREAVLEHCCPGTLSLHLMRWCGDGEKTWVHTRVYAQIWQIRAEQSSGGSARALLPRHCASAHRKGVVHTSGAHS